MIDEHSLGRGDHLSLTKIENFKSNSINYFNKFEWQSWLSSVRDFYKNSSHNKSCKLAPLFCKKTNITGLIFL